MWLEALERAINWIICVKMSFFLLPGISKNDNVLLHSTQMLTIACKSLFFYDCISLYILKWKSLAKLNSKIYFLKGNTLKKKKMEQWKRSPQHPTFNLEFDMNRYRCVYINKVLTFHFISTAVYGKHQKSTKSSNWRVTWEDNPNGK